MRIVFVFLFCLYTSLSQAKVAEADMPVFYTMNRQDGLSEDSVLQLMQLPDGRILMKALHGIDLYDGISFAHIPSSEADFIPLPAYKGATHLYPDGNRLWVKERLSIACYNLQRLCPCGEMEAALPDSLLDFYMDHTGRQWWVMSDGIHRADGQLVLKSPEAPHPMI
ncbi:MAG: hypothetical protein K6F94_00880, partial [Bacteroidaceae bacterium]|nr:hypothetical protein [Bacteroidaceae bacterium]